MIIDFKDVKIEKLSAIHNTDPFDCGDPDINDFLQNDALKYQQENLAVSFIFIYNEEIIGFFCCSGDSIRLKISEKKKDELGEKEIPEFPAIKIGRLGRDINFKEQKLGEKILKWALGYARDISNRLGIRYMTLDSYPGKVEMYERFGFKRNLHDQYSEKEHVSMRFDIHNPKG